VVRAIANRFPHQAAGFLFLDGRLYQIAVTPVYVAAVREPALLNVLVAGYAVDSNLAEQLKAATGGSDFAFLANGKMIASTLESAALGQLEQVESPGGRLRQVRLGKSDYTVLATPLLDVEGRPIGELRILRSFEGARRRIMTLRTNIVVMWLIAV